LQDPKFGHVVVAVLLAAGVEALGQPLAGCLQDGEVHGLQLGSRMRFAVLRQRVLVAEDETG